MKGGSHPRYLGDGVYASFDGYQVWLHVGSHENEAVVALEPEVIAEINRYTQDMQRRHQPPSAPQVGRQDGPD